MRRALQSSLADYGGVALHEIHTTGEAPVRSLGFPSCFHPLFCRAKQRPIQPIQPVQIITGLQARVRISIFPFQTSSHISIKYLNQRRTGPWAGRESGREHVEDQGQQLVCPLKLFFWPAPGLTTTYLVSSSSSFAPFSRPVLLFRLPFYWAQSHRAARRRSS